MKFKLSDKQHTIKSGDLCPLTTEHGHIINEFKDYFNYPLGFNNPVVIFNENLTLELKRTDKGFSGGKVSQGIKYGCNLNRIRNRPGRYGITVWQEELEKVAV